MRSDRFYVVQIGIEIPADLDASDTLEEAPRMGELLERVLQVADEFGDGAMVSGYVYNARGQHDCLVATLVYHRAVGDDGCACGWRSVGDSHEEHVARVFEVASAREASQ